MTDTLNASPPAPAHAHAPGGVGQPRVAVVSLGRPSARGECRRVASWTSIFEAAGCHVDVLPLLTTCGRRRPPSLRALRDIWRGDTVTEGLLWSTADASLALDQLEPDLVICVTARAYDPALTTRPVLLDFVDRLSTNYEARGALAGGARRALYAILARSNARFEARAHAVWATTAAGAADARELASLQVPIVVPRSDFVPQVTPDVDILFTGSLAYGPNIDALNAMGDLWPRVEALRPGTTMLVAGADPVPEVRHLATRHGWELLADFTSSAEVHGRARVAIAPLRIATGIQTKVLDAAGLGVAQVISPAAAGGLPAGFPGVVATGYRFVDEVIALLDDDDRRADVADCTRAWAEATCGLRGWAGWARALLDSLPEVSSCRH